VKATDWTKDDELIAQAHNSTERGRECWSVLVANWQGKRGAVKCVAKGNHDTHKAANEETWAKDASGCWTYQGTELSDINTKGAEGPVVEGN
jgi:hypothetical protein